MCIITCIITTGITMGVVNASLKDTTQIYLSFHYIIPTQSTDHNGDGIIYTG